VDTEYLSSNDSSDRKGVEGVDKGLPDLNVASSLALIVKSID
jgi:hypothetical protein